MRLLVLISIFIFALPLLCAAQLLRSAAAVQAAQRQSAGEALTYKNSQSTLKMAKPYRPGDTIEFLPLDDAGAPQGLPPAPAEPAQRPPAAGVAGKTAPAASAAGGEISEGKLAAVPAVPEPVFKKAAVAPKPRQPRDKIKWRQSSSANFDVFAQPRATGVATPNLNMKFETAHQVLRKNIPWLIAGKSDVYIYQNRESFLSNEPQASSWSAAFFSPSDDAIVMYDETKNTDGLIRQFTHELTHLFVEDYFNPPGESFKLEPPIWVNEGLAVNMEDIATDSKGGVWASDLVVINILSEKEREAAAQQSIGAGPTGARKSGRLQSSAPRAAGLPAAAGPRVSNKFVTFKNFSKFIKQDSYDKAAAEGDVENWYFQAYAMVRFLFKPYNAVYPEKRMQFQQFMKLLNGYREKKDASGKIVKDADGRTIMVRVSAEDALARAYGFKNTEDFEARFWDWLRDLQKTERDKLINGKK
jgi:hypothetical protein